MPFERNTTLQMPLHSNNYILKNLFCDRFFYLDETHCGWSTCTTRWHLYSYSGREVNTKTNGKFDYNNSSTNFGATIGIDFYWNNCGLSIKNESQSCEWMSECWVTIHLDFYCMHFANRMAFIISINKSFFYSFTLSFWLELCHQHKR